MASGSAVNVSLHYGLCSPLCVSGSPRSEHSALWIPAGPPGAGRSDRPPACPRAGRTWPDREGAARGAPGGTWSGCSAGGRRSRTALPPAASANPSGPCRRRHLHMRTRVGQSQESSCRRSRQKRHRGNFDGKLAVSQRSEATKYKYFMTVVRCVFFWCLLSKLLVQRLFPILRKNRQNWYDTTSVSTDTHQGDALRCQHTHSRVL